MLLVSVVVVVVVAVVVTRRRNGPVACQQKLACGPILCQREQTRTILQWREKTHTYQSVSGLQKQNGRRHVMVPRDASFGALLPIHSVTESPMAGPPHSLSAINLQLRAMGVRRDILASFSIYLSWFAANSPPWPVSPLLDCPLSTSLN